LPNKKEEEIVSRKSLNKKGWLAFPAAALLIVVLMAGCSAMEKQQVCEGTPEHVVLVASTSMSDLKLSRRFSPVIAKQAVNRAAVSCGSLRVGLLGGTSAEADLELRAHQFTPAKKDAYGSAEAIRRPMEEAGEKFAEDELLQPLRRAAPVGGSPFLNGLARISAELEARHIDGATVVLIGDGVAVEKGVNGEQISFADGQPDAAAVRAFAPLYTQINGSCVILAGSGAEANLTDQQLRVARQLLGEALEDAGAKFVSTRGDDIPWGC
jgi:hypothetical protein